MEIAHGHRAGLEKTAQGKHLLCLRANAIENQVLYVLPNLWQELQILFVIHQARKGDLVAFCEVLQDIERADLVSLIGWKRNPMCEEQDSHWRTWIID
jgi:hypothetical protein